MKFRLRFLLTLTAIIALAFWIGVYCWPMDGVVGNILLLLGGGEDTEWASGYTDRGFRAASVGMTREQVYTLLGPPLYTGNHPGNEVVEWWTRSPGDTHYRERALVFRGDTVVEKVCDVWID